MLEALQASSLHGFQQSTVATRTIFREPLHCREKHEQKRYFAAAALKKEEPHPGLQHCFGGKRDRGGPLMFNVSVRPQPAAVAAVSALAATVPHVEPWSHLLFFLSGNGDITINGNVTAVKSGTVCQVRAG